VTRTAAALIAAVTLLAALFAFKAAGKMPDFEVYHTAGARALASAPLYRPDDGHYQFKYWPAFALLIAPFAWLPLLAAKALWFTLSAMLMAVLVALSIAILPAPRRPVWLLATATFVAMAKFLGHELILGQVNIAFAAAILAAVLMMRYRHEVRAGLLIALAIVLKPYAVLFLPWLVARRQIASSAAAAGGVLIALLAPATVYGFAGNIALHREWWTTVRESTAPNLLNPDNVSLAAMYAKWIGMQAPAAWLASLTGAALLMLVVMMFLRRRTVPFPEALEAAMLLTLIPLLSPQGWDYVFLISMPAVTLIVNHADLLPRPLRYTVVAALLVIAFTIYDIVGREAYRAFMDAAVISVCYLVVIAALAMLRFRGAA
jgi:hypothetical protein